jgi:hypothetical protein
VRHKSRDERRIRGMTEVGSSVGQYRAAHSTTYETPTVVKATYRCSSVSGMEAHSKMGLERVEVG